jgi:hypothetical protein
MIRRYWAYTAEEFPGGDSPLDDVTPRTDRPPVFKKLSASLNIITPNVLGPSEVRSLHKMIPPEKRHRWFRSMSSSHALAQSFFGTLSVIGKDRLLEDVETEEGDKPFGPGQGVRSSIELEVAVDHLGEPRPTSIDVSFRGARHVGIEVKLTEGMVGACSRPRLMTYDPQYCNGSCTYQLGRRSRCSLSEIGVRYWEHLPKLFRIDSTVDHLACPLDRTYQLVRNVLSVCILTDGTPAPNGQVVLLCDDRNPSFHAEGSGERAYRIVREALLEPSRYQRCSWQTLAGILRGDRELAVLSDHLDRKYGL